jgi:hypothetical protein
MSENDYSDSEQISLSNVLQKYKSTKGAADKRRETSKANMAKARAAKLAALKQKKEQAEREIEVDDSDSDDDSEDSDGSDSSDDGGGELVIKKLKRQVGGSAGNARIERLEKAIMLLAKQKQKQKGGKKAPVKRKTVIQVNQPPVITSAPNPKAEVMKHSILRF